MAEWDIFPFEGELLVKRLADPEFPEPARHGDDPADCTICARSDADYLWTSERWRLGMVRVPQSVPTLMLEPRAHLDLGDLDDQLAAEMGVVVVRIERAVAAVSGVGRVQVYRIGDGATHLHVWFFARPEGMLQLRGSSLVDWSDILPPMPTEEWSAFAAAVARNLGGG